jgi:uncharacterized protein (DUF1330 family)
MPAYLFAEVEVLDPVAYEEYRKLVPAAIAAHGGRYLARGGTAELLEGQGEPQRLVILEFPDLARLRAFHRSPEYRPLIALRQRAARSRLLAVEGL